jgi:hypothetical protein
LGQDVSIMVTPTKSQSERGSTWIGESYSNSPYAPRPTFGLKRKSPRLNDRKEGNIE